MSFDRSTVQFNPPTQHPDADTDVLASVLCDDGSIEVWEANFDGATWWSSNATMIMSPVVSWAHKPEGVDLTGDFTAEPEPAGASHWTESEPVRLPASRAGRVYVAGPMTGLPDLNFPAFNAEAAMLRAQGLTVINPAEHGVVEGADWADYLRHDLAGLVSCERIHLLPGWSKSKGANLEVLTALMLGMQITTHPHADAVDAASVLAFVAKVLGVSGITNPLVVALATAHHAVEACKSATGRHRAIETFVNKASLAHEVVEAVKAGEPV